MNTSIGRVRVKAADARLPAGVIALAGLCAAALSGVAAAQSPSDEPLQKVVSYGDLDLNSQLDARIMHGRLRVAAREVCEPLAFRPPQLDYRECLRDAIARAIEEVDRPMLTAYRGGANVKHPTRLAVATPRQAAE